jgi:hypothetical protein
MGELRLGDVIDDYCIKCKRLTNHQIVSLLHNAAAKVRCCSCYNDHDYRHEQVPPTKKELKMAELAAQALAAGGAAAPEPAPEAEPPAAKKTAVRKLKR